MQINDQANNKLVINADSTLLTINVCVNDGFVFKITMDQVRALLPSLSAARAALEEAEIVKKKNTLDSLRAQVSTLQTQIAEIEAL